MKLRAILIILAVFAFLFASAGALLYYSSLKETARLEAKRQAALRTDSLKSGLTSFINEYEKPAKTMARMEEVENALTNPGSGTIQKANVILDTFHSSLNAEACYLMDQNGTTIASSNRNDPDSFVHKNFSFRPYFKKSISGDPFLYLALGTASNRRGAYYSHPVFKGSTGNVIGVAVIKASIELIESRLHTDHSEAFHVTNPDGIIFISSNPDLLYKTVRRLNREEKKQIRESKQFGQGPWKYYKQEDDQYLKNRVALPGLTGWHLVVKQNLDSVTRRIYGPVIKTTGLVALLFTLFFGGTICLLYTLASRELKKGKKAEDKLKANEEKYRSIYHNTPAMLHSINQDFCLINVSDYWLEMTGYTRDEVLGRKLTDFFTFESGHRAETKILPEFFRGPGINRDIPYQLVKKDGGIMEILLSCYGIRDENGTISRTLAVSVDITDRVKQQKELDRVKKEKVSATIMEKQELERGIIARELHDELGQTLTALKMDAVSITGQIPEENRLVHEHIRTMSSLIEQIIHDVKSLAFRLRPGSLDDLGLVDSIESLAGDFEKRTDIRVRFTHCDIPPLGYTVKTAIYRIIQEALTNCAKHSQAQQCEIMLSFHSSILSVTIRDDGRGFDADNRDNGRSLGIIGMKERAALAGGEISIESKEGAGTRITLTVAHLNQSHIPPNEVRQEKENV